MGCVEDSPQKTQRRRQKTQILFVLFVLLFVTFVVNPSFAAARQEAERININTAPAEEFMRIPGIGPSLAARLVEYRRKHGRFKRPQEIIIVRGMSAKRYRQIAHLIRI
jgi:competence ComEA-like helix-hairpin-helix protein